MLPGGCAETFNSGRLHMIGEASSMVNKSFFMKIVPSESMFETICEPHTHLYRIAQPL
jgi:hypothetical protein